MRVFAPMFSHIAFMLQFVSACNAQVESSATTDAGTSVMDAAPILGLAVFSGDAAPSYADMCLAACSLPNAYPETCPNNPYCAAACPNAKSFPAACLPYYATYVKCLARALASAGGCVEQAVPISTVPCGTALATSNDCHSSDGSQP
jgi:hypothetical protein